MRTLRFSLVFGLFALLFACSTEPVDTPNGGDAATDSSAADAGPTNDSTASADGSATTADAGAEEGQVYAVGVITIKTIGANGRELPTEVWYPAKPGQQGTPAKYAAGLIPSPFGALRNVEAVAGKFPLIAFSHGNSGVRDQSVFLMEAFARRGYVVVSPDHVGNTAIDFDQKLFGVMFLWRPQDLVAAIARVLTKEKGDPAWLHGLIDGKNIGVSGHSFGGFTTLAIAGIPVDIPSNVTIDCGATEPDPMCAEMKILGPKPWQFAQGEIKVAIPLAHAFYAAGSLLHSHAPKLKVPTVMLVGTDDTLTPPAVEAEPLYQAMTAERAMITIHGGSHFSFANMCEFKAFAPANLKAEIDKLCGPNVKPPLNEVHAKIAEYAVAAADLYLKGDESKRAMFAPKAKGSGYISVKSEGITK